ncbi:hypothetical protein [Pseudonocardia charpentierae]|uniref:Protein kilB n=1 Tax=Pseudonocardia charpentierae TaxID=3075545 RepID=A0ABU2NJ83_9PSEU|nr:hypothetical protein [Pseudonocardia sp. DSM 45834]MDT0353959.1 hypothetical protein [Pseudonocardia sp. DSM 45834]
MYASLIAVAGTLLGSLSTYLFQRRTAARSEAIAREERFRQDRLAACGEFAAAVTELKRAVVTAWFRRKNQDDEWRKAMTDADMKGSTAEGALMTMLLLIDDTPLRTLAEDFFAHIDTLRTASSKTELEAREAEFAEKRLRFIAAARTFVG